MCPLFKLAYLHFSKSLAIRYSRRSNVMPPNAKEVKYHPSSVNLLLVKILLEDSKAKDHTLLQHLCSQYSNIDRALALQITEELGEEFSPTMPVRDLREEKLIKITQLFKQMRFTPPDGSCLSPAGEYNLRLGIMKELKPDMIATYQEK